MLTAPKHDIDEPRRAKLRTEMAAPSEAKSSRDKEEPRCIFSITETDEPKFKLLRIENVDAMFT
jgi:hypothetical protein